jgi:hypothetical protein
MDELVTPDTDDRLVYSLFCSRPENSFVDIKLKVFFEARRFGTAGIYKNKEKCEQKKGTVGMEPTRLSGCCRPRLNAPGQRQPIFC